MNNKDITFEIKHFYDRKPWIDKKSPHFHEHTYLKTTAENKRKPVVIEDAFVGTEEELWHYIQNTYVDVDRGSVDYDAWLYCEAYPTTNIRDITKFTYNKKLVKEQSYKIHKVDG